MNGLIEKLFFDYSIDQTSTQSERLHSTLVTGSASGPKRALMGDRSNDLSQPQSGREHSARLRGGITRSLRLQPMPAKQKK